MPKIIFNIPESEPHKVALTLDHERVSVGRKKPCDIILLHPSISSTHCHFKRVNGGFELVDRDSTNGISFEGSKIKKLSLKEDTKFYLGDVSVTFKYSSDELLRLSGKQSAVSNGKPKRPQLPPLPD